MDFDLARRFGCCYEYGSSLWSSDSTGTNNAEKSTWRSYEEGDQPAFDKFSEYSSVWDEDEVEMEAPPSSGITIPGVKFVFDDDSVWDGHQQKSVPQTVTPTVPIKAKKLEYGPSFNASVLAWIRARAPAQAIIEEDIEFQPNMTLVDVPETVDARTVTPVTTQGEEHENPAPLQFAEVPASRRTVECGVRCQAIGMWSLGRKMEYTVRQRSGQTTIFTVPNTASGRRRIARLGVTPDTVYTFVSRVMAKCEDRVERWAVQAVDHWKWRCATYLPQGPVRLAVEMDVLLNAIKVPPDKVSLVRSRIERL